MCNFQNNEGGANCKKQAKVGCLLLVCNLNQEKSFPTAKHDIHDLSLAKINKKVSLCCLLTNSIRASLISQCLKIAENVEFEFFSTLVFIAKSDMSGKTV